jgi:hypothetical protein
LPKLFLIRLLKSAILTSTIRVSYPAGSFCFFFLRCSSTDYFYVLLIVAAGTVQCYFLRIQQQRRRF